MGHDSCGAIHEALNRPGEQEENSPNLNHLIHEIRNNLNSGPARTPLTELNLADAIQKNVSSVATDLTVRSKIIREAVKSGQVNIVQAQYGLSSGKVHFGAHEN